MSLAIVCDYDDAITRSLLYLYSTVARFEEIINNKFSSHIAERLANSKGIAAIVKSLNSCLLFLFVSGHFVID